MMLKFINDKTEIKQFVNTEKFAEQTCLQINKDLQGLSILRLNFHLLNQSERLDALIKQLEPILQKVYNLGKLTAFIYRVDLSEKKYIALLEKEDFYELAYAIIKREAQKVYLRSKL